MKGNAMFTYQKFQYDKNVSSPQVTLQVNYSSNQNPNGTLPIIFEKSIVKLTMKRHGPTTAKTLTTRKNKRGNVLLELEGFLSNQDYEGLAVLVQGKSRAQKEIHVYMLKLDLYAASMVDQIGYVYLTSYTKSNLGGLQT